MMSPEGDLEPDPASPTPTIYDVARAAGVSVATVSRALNNSGYVSGQARLRIEQAVHALAYLPNPLAQGLSGGQSGVWGFIAPEFDDPYWSEVAQTTETLCERQKLALIVAASHWDGGQEADAVGRLIRFHCSGAILCTPARLSSIDALCSAGIPVVVRGSCSDGPVEAVDQVLSDNRHGGYLVARHLLDLGHRHILFLGFPQRYGVQQPRYLGYLAALEERALAPLTCPWKSTMDAETMRLLRQVIDGPERPTAVFAASDYGAIRVWELLERLGLRVPDDVSVVGYGNSRASHVIRCGLTTVDDHKDSQTRQVFSWLAERVAGKAAAPARRHLITPVLVVRGSVSPPSTP